MGIFDFDDEEDYEESSDLFEEEDFLDNEYLKEEDKALGLISCIIPKEKPDLEKKNRLQRIDALLDEELLGTLKNVQLMQEAHVQLELVSLTKKIEEERKYNALKNKAIVGIGGKFSAGKSGLINSLLHVKKLLPEDQNPTTSIATYIVKSDCQRIMIYTEGNSESEIDVEALNALTHNFYEKYKIGFSSFINCIVVNETEMPYENIVFLDTPGYSKPDLFDSSNVRTDQTDANKALSQLSGVDHMIWLVDIENGEISNSDIDFIKKVNVTTPILFVLNKADKKEDTEIPGIIDKVVKTTKANGLSVYGVTAYSKYDGEWNDNCIIQDFLENISKEQKSKIDVCRQISNIKTKINENIDEVSSENEQGIRELFGVIADCNNVIEIKSLVDIYGEKRKNQRDIERCRNLFGNNINELERMLKSHYGGA